MTTFGNRQSGPGAPGAKPTFGKKTSQAPAPRAMPAAKSGLSSGSLAFLQADHNRAPAAAPAPASRQIPGYAAPAAQTTSQTTSQTAGHTAGKPVWGRRVIAALIDVAVLIVPLVLIIGVMVPQPQTTDAQFARHVGVFVFLSLGGLAYAIGMESSSRQATLGKLAVGAIVTDKTGGKPTLGAIIMRNTLGKLVSGLTPFYISYLMGLARKDRRCLHDLMAGTMVCAKSKTSFSYDQTFA
jgi:uncharacterized RDD family membrane protein YckC